MEILAVFPRAFDNEHATPTDGDMTVERQSLTLLIWLTRLLDHLFKYPFIKSREELPKSFGCNQLIYQLIYFNK